MSLNRFNSNGFINNNKDNLYNTISSQRGLYPFNTFKNPNPIKIPNTFNNRFSEETRKKILDSNPFFTVFNYKVKLPEKLIKNNININSTSRFSFLKNKQNIEIQTLKSTLPKINQHPNITFRKKTTSQELILNDIKDKKSLTYDKFKTREKYLDKKIKLNLTSRIIEKPKNKKIKIPKLDSFDIRTCPGSKNGATKINQDSYIAMTKIDEIPNYKIFGVFDGHGYNGEDISKSVSNYFIDYFENIKFYDKTPIHIFNDYKNNNYNLIRECFKKCDENLHKTLNCENSGTTVNIINIIDTKIIYSNLGDSRSIFIDKNNNIIQLIKDHIPENVIEKERINNMGGEISRVDWCEYGPLRIWFKGKNYPGLAMSRSLGDFDTEKIGVINEPEICDIDIVESNIKICVCATDGLWEFLSNQKVCDIVLGYYNSNDAKGATRKLMEVAKKNWEVHNNMGIDDITIVVLFFK